MTNGDPDVYDGRIVAPGGDVSIGEEVNAMFFEAKSAKSIDFSAPPVVRP